MQKISKNNGYKKFRVTNYDPKLMKRVHNQKDHKYLISNSILQADVVINVPKLKTHRKAGITASLKNTVGINGHKDWLPHHRTGSSYEGGDEYLNPSLLKKILTRLNEFNDILFIRNNQVQKIIKDSLFFLKSLLYFTSSIMSNDKYFEGNWYGNDTIWRTIADLNQILLYATKNGQIGNTIQRKRIYFCDGIISGESEGPLEPSPNFSGIIIGGFDPLMVDLAFTEIINFDFKKIPQINNLFKLKERKISNFQPDDLKIISNYENWNNTKINEIVDIINFKPTQGWENHIEK